jgi:tetratricopeptide (TPR) repeat protein
VDSIETFGERAKAEYAPLVAQANAAALIIKDAKTYEEAANIDTMLKDAIKDVHAKLDDFVDDAHKTWKKAVARRDGYIDPLSKARETLKIPLWQYQQDEKERQRKEQEALDLKAKKEAEDRKLQEAMHAEEMGNKEEAEAILEEPINVAPAIAPVNIPKVKGFTGPRDNYSAQVTDMAALLKAIANGSVPMAAIEPNHVFLNGQARQLKKEMKYPGVRVLNNNQPI